MYCHPFLCGLHSLGRARKQARALSGVIHVHCSTNDLASQSPLDDALCRSHLYLSVIGYVLRRLCVLINQFIRKSNCVVRAGASSVRFTADTAQSRPSKVHTQIFNPNGGPFSPATVQLCSIREYIIEMFYWRPLHQNCAPPSSKPNFTTYDPSLPTQRAPKMRQTLYFPSCSTNYLLPAIFLNPAVVLHVINTAVSHLQGVSCARSFSSNPFIESLGPVPGSTLYLDMHANDRLCWKYTALMVLVQLLVMWKMHKNTEIEEEGDMILPTERDTEQGRMRESAVDVDDPAQFDMKYMVNGQ
jgi:hypothetical protein